MGLQYVYTKISLTSGNFFSSPTHAPSASIFILFLSFGGLVRVNEVCHGIHDPVSLFCRGGVLLMKRATQIIFITPPCSQDSLRAIKIIHHSL